MTTCLPDRIASLLAERTFGRCKISWFLGGGYLRVHSCDPAVTTPPGPYGADSTKKPGKNGRGTILSKGLPGESKSVRQMLETRP